MPHLNIDPTSLSLFASGILGVGVFFLASRIMATPGRTTTSTDNWEFEYDRRESLREAILTYRIAEPFIDELSQLDFVKSLGDRMISTSINRGGIPLPINAVEFISLRVIEAIGFLLGLLSVACVFSAGYLLAVCVGSFLAVFYLFAAVRSLNKDAELRMELIIRRLPFAIDLMGLMLHAGADLVGALQAVVRESGDHPFADEFQTVIDDLHHGRMLADVLDDLDQRMQCEPIREIVLSIRKSRKLGTPLADTFVDLADQMRLKKSQWGEAAAGKAQVKISFPGLLIMFACMITLSAPFLLSILNSTSAFK